MADLPTGAELCRDLYEKGDPKVRILYKYRSCAPRNIGVLRSNEIWLSRHEDLNDPFDCLVRFPSDPAKANLSALSRVLQGAHPYTLEIADGQAAVEYISAAKELGPLECIGLLASQLQFTTLLDHIKSVRADDTGWLATLVDLSIEVHRTMLTDTGVFSLSESPDHPLMWAHYAGSHSGYCIGYVCPTGIDSPRNIHKVKYVDHVPVISAKKLVHDTHHVMLDLILTKPSIWQYEREWRITLGTIAGLVKDWIAPRQIIFGARIDPADEHQIRQSLAAEPIEFLRIAPSLRMGQFRLELVPA